ncbi:MAG TPA: ATP-binding protein, partial [Solirubrobacteraceae bacterium]
MPDRQPLIERETELEALERVLARLADGEGGFVVLTGPAGIGKTSLLAHARARAATETIRVLSARGSELERAFPFGGARQLLAPLVLPGARTDPDDLFAGAAGLARAVVEPGAAPAAPASPDAEFALLHGLYWLIANLAAAGPVLLLVDDAQWLDAPTLAFLGFLARRVRDLPVALLVASRPADDPTAEPGVAPLLVDPEAGILRPSALSLDGVARRVRERTGRAGDDGFVRACAEVTGGNPFLLEELLRELGAEGVAPEATASERIRALGPRGVAAVTRLRLERLGDDARTLARWIAVLGDRTLSADLAALAELPDAAALRGLAALQAAELVGDDGGFVHPIVRQAVLHDLPAATRAGLHAEAAARLAGRGAPAEEVAAQLMAAPPAGDPARVAVLREAADRARAVGDAAGAARLRRRALQEPAGAEESVVLLELGEDEALAGDPAAVEHLHRALAGRPAPAAVERATTTLVDLLMFSGEADRAADVLEAGVEALGAGSPGGQRIGRQAVGVAHTNAPVRARLAATLQALADPGPPPFDAAGLSAAAALAWRAAIEDLDAGRAAELGLRAL